MSWQVPLSCRFEADDVFILPLSPEALHAFSSLVLLSASSGTGEMWRMMAQARNLPLAVPVSVFLTDNKPIN